MIATSYMLRAGNNTPWQLMFTETTTRGASVRSVSSGAGPQKTRSGLS